jgi:hypothetical protein
MTRFVCGAVSGFATALAVAVAVAHRPPVAALIIPADPGQVVTGGWARGEWLDGDTVRQFMFDADNLVSFYGDGTFDVTRAGASQRYSTVEQVPSDVLAWFRRMYRAYVTTACRGVPDVRFSNNNGEPRQLPWCWRAL